jgi:hypothetical protein
MDSNFDMVPLKLRPEIVAGAKLNICKNNICADAQYGQTATPRTIGLQSISTYDVLIVTG